MGMQIVFLLLIVPLSTLAFYFTDGEKNVTLQPTNIQVIWLSKLSIEIKLADNTTYTIILTPASNIPGRSTPCLFSGKLQQDNQSLVSVSGCKDTKKTSLSIASKLVSGGLIDISFVDGVSFIIGKDVQNGEVKFKHQRGLQINTDDVLIPSQIRNEMESYFNDPLPASVEVETSIKYDRGLLEKFDGNKFKIEEWISRMVELAKSRLSHPSLTVAVHLKVVDMELINDYIRADSFTLSRLASQNRQSKRVVSYFGLDLCRGSCTVGYAYRDAACLKNGYAININEYFTDRNSELHTARCFAHELGHNLGMKHDFHSDHGGTSGPCNGDGLMSYKDSQDKWSSCSNSDFEAWYRKEGHACLGEAPLPLKATTKSPEGNCAFDEFDCNNSWCTPLQYKCDGDNDCGNGADEENCNYWFFN